MIKVALVGITAIITAILFKKGKEEFSFYISIGACVIILLMGISKLEVILDAIDKLKRYININQNYVDILIKIVGITYVTEFASALCKDSGYQAIAGQIELVGKLTILAMGMPILLALLETISSFLTA
ncbi:MAG: stage III sporulation protein AD [Clostridiales bacterium]|nr:stage III sporulation protein AD [Clostridiales bacterium]